MPVATVMNEPVAIAILAKAPEPGFAKTRLIPVLGPERAALLQARLIERTAQTACAAAIGPVSLWATPDERHPVFQAVVMRRGQGRIRDKNSTDAHHARDVAHR